jgi:hypothetical protein
MDALHGDPRVFLGAPQVYFTPNFMNMNIFRGERMKAVYKHEAQILFISVIFFLKS